MISSAMADTKQVGFDMFRPRHMAIFVELASSSTFAANVTTNVAVVLTQAFKIIINIKILKILKISLWLNKI